MVTTVAVAGAGLAGTATTAAPDGATGFSTVVCERMEQAVASAQTNMAAITGLITDMGFSALQYRHERLVSPGRCACGNSLAPGALMLFHSAPGTNDPGPALLRKVHRES